MLFRDFQKQPALHSIALHQINMPGEQILQPMQEAEIAL
jgi:hypothetical protein